MRVFTSSTEIKIIREQNSKHRNSKVEEYCGGTRWEHFKATNIIWKGSLIKYSTLKEKNRVWKGYGSYSVANGLE